MYEHRTHRLLSPAEFLKRVGWHGLVAFGVMAFGLGIGVLGYHRVGHLSWIDSLLNASMILGGMGPIAPIQTPGGKFFAGCYALFSGLLILSVAGIIFAPIAHRLMHKFHLQTEETKSRPEKTKASKA